jgi:thiol-disulfide isomerase/thioredoxin
MKSFMKTVPILAALVLVLAVRPALPVNKGKISSGELAAMIRDSEARVVVVNFWSTWCGPCRKEIPGLIELRWEYPEDELVIIGVSLDYNTGTVTAFDEKLGINYPVYIGGRDVMEDYEISAIPKHMIYNENGLAEVHEGYMPTRVLKKLIENMLADDGAGEDLQ